MSKHGSIPNTWEQVLAAIHARIPVGDAKDCWEIEGARTPAGYGIIQARAFSKQPLYTHRVILAEKLGRELADDEEVLHTCDNPPCNNANHLEAGSRKDNMQDCIGKGRFKIGGRTSGTWTKERNPHRA